MKATKNKRGRPSLDTPERRAKILETIRGGNYRDVAARAAGIGPATLRDWARKDSAFSAAIEEAETYAEMHCLALILKAAASDPKHAQWWLERKFPERWGRRTHLALSGGTSSAVQVDVRSLSDAELEKLVSGGE